MEVGGKGTKRGRDTQSDDHNDEAEVQAVADTTVTATSTGGAGITTSTTGSGTGEGGESQHQLSTESPLKLADHAVLRTLLDGPRQKVCKEHRLVSLHENMQYAIPLHSAANAIAHGGSSATIVTFHLVIRLLYPLCPCPFHVISYFTQENTKAKVHRCMHVY
eukprot:TRINITY_DN1782_c0_g1_i2.p1 TRINITY_DN1782_c0_g1~~TRINITY_DN1782_c0_g1_i2.p1  ORF type:complete len:163 (+),score=25.00 TRINITY_DN1782_c0_g1_i2:32-520(+)